MSLRGTRRVVAVVALGGALVLPASAAWAQDGADQTGVGQDQTGIGQAQATPEPTGGIGDADAVECTGAVAVSVVDRDGKPIPGAVVSVAGQRTDGNATVPAPCGEVGASLLTSPDGYAPAGATSTTARITHGATVPVSFVVDEVEVLGTSFTQPPPESAPAAPAPEAAPPTPAAPELPNTGPDQAPRLALLAALLLLGGVAALRAGRELA